MTTSKYLKAFKQAVTTCREEFEIVGDGLLVEEIPPEEVKTKGGILIASSTPLTSIEGLEANRPCFVRVLATGEGYFEEDGTHVPLDCKPGDIILVGKLNVKWLSVFGTIVPHGGAQIGLVAESSMQLRFMGDEAYARFFSTLQEIIACQSGSI